MIIDENGVEATEADCCIEYDDAHSYAVRHVQHVGQEGRGLELDDSCYQAGDDTTNTLNLQLDMVIFFAIRPLLAIVLPAH